MLGRREHDLLHGGESPDRYLHFLIAVFRAVELMWYGKRRTVAGRCLGTYEVRLARFYASAWRERYGGEFNALLEYTPAGRRQCSMCRGPVLQCTGLQTPIP